MFIFLSSQEVYFCHSEGLYAKTLRLKISLRPYKCRYSQVLPRMHQNLITLGQNMRPQLIAYAKQRQTIKVSAYTLLFVLALLRGFDSCFQVLYWHVLMGFWGILASRVPKFGQQFFLQAKWLVNCAAIFDER